MPFRTTTNVSALGILLAALLSLSIARADHANSARTDGGGCELVDASTRAVMTVFERPPPAQPPAELLALGSALFYDPRLSGSGDLSCASCHRPEEWFSSADPPVHAERSVLSLLDVSQSTWFFWDGRADSLWSAAGFPILSMAEMGGSIANTRALIVGDLHYRELFVAAFPDAPVLSVENSSLYSVNIDEAIFVGALKALEAFQETLRSPLSRFDIFLETALRNDPSCADYFTHEEAMGFVLFTGEAGCANCHFGSAFSDDSFHDIGAHPDPTRPALDRGRYSGLEIALTSPYNAIGPFSELPLHDDRVRRLAYLQNGREWWSAYRTPRLRTAARTAPYMHNNMLATLEDVVDFYDRGGGMLGHGHQGGTVLRPLDLSQAEKHALVAFLEALADPATLHEGAP